MTIITEESLNKLYKLALEKKLPELPTDFKQQTDDYITSQQHWPDRHWEVMQNLTNLTKEELTKQTIFKVRCINEH